MKPGSCHSTGSWGTNQVAGWRR